MNRHFMKRSDFDRKVRQRFFEAYRSHRHGRSWLAALRMARLRRHLTVRDLFRLDRHFRSDIRFAPIAEIRSRTSNADFGTIKPAMSRLLIHEPEGHAREAAVHALPAPEADPMLMALLVVRANDWVASVQSAAKSRLAETVHRADSSVLVPLVPELLDRVTTWGRGGSDVLEFFESRQDWPEILLESFLTESNGPLAVRLRLILKHPVLDAHVEALATRTMSSFVRAIATEVVLTGKTKWIRGYGYRWIDKTMGLRRRVAIWGEREVDIEDAVRASVLRKAARDRNVQVRKLTGDLLIREGLSETDILNLLSVDKSVAVLDRVEFARRKWDRTRKRG